MRLYGKFKASKNLDDIPFIDYIEFKFDWVYKEFLDTAKGPHIQEGPFTLPCDWEDSEWVYDPKTGEGDFCFENVFINKIDADCELDAVSMFQHAEIDAIQIFAPDGTEYLLTELYVKTCDVSVSKWLSFKNEAIKPKTIYYEKRKEKI